MQDPGGDQRSIEVFTRVQSELGCRQSEEGELQMGEEHEKIEEWGKGVRGSPVFSGGAFFWTSIKEEKETRCGAE